MTQIYIIDSWAHMGFYSWRLFMIHTTGFSESPVLPRNSPISNKSVSSPINNTARTCQEYFSHVQRHFWIYRQVNVVMLCHSQSSKSRDIIVLFLLFSMTSYRHLKYGIMGIHKVTQEGFDNTHNNMTYKVFYNNRNKHVTKISFRYIVFAKVLCTWYKDHV